MREEGPADLHTAVRPRGVWGWKLRPGIKQRTPSSKSRREKRRASARGETEFYNSAVDSHVWRWEWWRKRRNRGSSATDETSREYIRRTSKCAWIHSALNKIKSLSFHRRFNLISVLFQSRKLCFLHSISVIRRLQVWRLSIRPRLPP